MHKKLPSDDRRFPPEVIESLYLDPPALDLPPLRYASREGAAFSAGHAARAAIRRSCGLGGSAAYVWAADPDSAQQVGDAMLAVPYCNAQQKLGCTVDGVAWLATCFSGVVGSQIWRAVVVHRLES